MKRLLLVAVTIALFIRPASADEGWREESKSKDLLIESRPRAGSSLREFRAVGVIHAPTRSVFAVLNDADAYPRFMPYVTQCRVLRREPNAIVFYQRLSFPIIRDRDFVLRTRFAESASENGPIFRMHWEPVNDIGPAPIAGVMRVLVCEGSWLLEPQDKYTTRATYMIYTDSGGALPSFIANTGSRAAIRKLFEAVRAQVKEANPAPN